MMYKTKITMLVVLNATLALIIIFGIAFDPARTDKRAGLYSWLDSGEAGRIERITINNQHNEIVLARLGEDWFVSADGTKIPALRFLMDDFINALTQRGFYPSFSTSAESHERLLLTEDTSMRIRAADETGQPLLDIHIGLPDITGRNIFLRRHGQDEVRSGLDVFSFFASSSPLFWYNLMLFPQAETGQLDVTSVRRLAFYPPERGGEESRPFIFTRSAGAWDVNSDITLDMDRVDSFIQNILHSSGDNIISHKDLSDIGFNDGRIVLEFAHQNAATIELWSDIDDRRYAIISGSGIVYSLPEHTWTRFFPDISDFAL